MILCMILPDAMYKLPLLLWFLMNRWGTPQWMLSYIKIIYSCVSLRPSVTDRESAETIWPRDVRDRISGHWALEARTRWSLWTAIIALATGTNTSFLDGLYKKQATMYTYNTCSDLQLAKQLDLSIHRRCEVVGSIPTQVPGFFSLKKILGLAYKLY